VNGNSDHPNSSADVLCTSGWFPQQVLPRGADETMLSTAYFSPNRAPGETFAGYPRTFISLGGADTFVEEVHELAGKMERNGVDVAVDVQVGVTGRG
jgi:acetyl esterase/lipase